MAQNIDVDISKVQIDRIQVLAERIENNSALPTIRQVQLDWKMTYSITPGINIEAEKIKLEFAIDLFSSDANHQPTGVNAFYSFALIFTVPDLKKHNHSKTGVDKNIFVTLSSIAYSTIRGMVYVKCQGTILGNLILPILTNSEIEEIIKSTHVKAGKFKD